jgi:protein gp37
MGKTSIEWVGQITANGVELPGFTFNPWIGCTRVSPGCDNCYAEVSTPARSLRVSWGKGQPRRLTSTENWQKPLKWNREAESCGFKLRVFSASLADWLDDEVQIVWLQRFLKLIAQTPNLEWLLLTKRPGNWESRMRAIVNLNDPIASLIAQNWLNGEAPSNIWVGVTAENQNLLQLRNPQLGKIPAKLKFLSCEPLLEPLDLSCAIEQINWVIAGGESGRNARVCDLGWLQSIADQCKDNRIPLFIKQLGNRPVDKLTPYAVGHKKGGDMHEWPGWAKIRQTPPLEAI